MIKRPNGTFVLELNDRLGKITIDTTDGKNFINEDQFKDALKDFDQKDSLGEKWGQAPFQIRYTYWVNK